MTGRPVRPYGWKRDAIGALPRWAEQLELYLVPRGRAGALGSFVRNPSQLELRTRRLYQGPFNACVAFALSSAIWTSARLNGWPMNAPPSPAFLYSIGRAREWAGLDPLTRPMLLDTGMYFSLAVRAAKELGFVSYDEWPYDREHVERAPPPHLFRSASDTSGLTWSAIEDRETRLEQVREAMSVGACVVFSMPVDRAFEMNDGSVIRSMSERTLGEHGMRVLAIDDDNQEVVVENWWDLWGIPKGQAVLGSQNAAGCGRLSVDLFTSDAIGNVDVVHVVPPPRDRA